MYSQIFLNNRMVRGVIPVFAIIALSMVWNSSHHSTPVPGPAADLRSAAVSPAFFTNNPATPQPRIAYGELPLSFEVNSGQADPSAKFTARGKNFGVLLAASQVVFLPGRAEPTGNANGARPGLRSPAPRTPRQVTAIHLKLVGSNPRAVIAGEQRLPGVVNYYIGKDPRKWRNDVPTFAQVRSRQVYPGIDVVYYGTAGRLEHDFDIEPGADASRITLEFDGGGGIVVEPDGDLSIQTESGKVSLLKPVAYQKIAGAQRQVAAGYVLSPDRRVHFQLGDYDHTRPLVIDPVLKYSTFLGGSGMDWGYGIAVDAAGDAYVAGDTQSADFPLKNAFDPHVPAVLSGQSFAFVTKLNSTGTAILFSTFLDGTSGYEHVGGIAVDAAGAAYVTGLTYSTDFPTTPGAFQTEFGGAEDAFIAKLSSTGSLEFATYLGGTSNDWGLGIAVDPSGKTYITGMTSSYDFPTTPGSFASWGQIFVASLNAAGSDLLYSAVFGWSGQEVSGHGIAVDSAGNAYVTGAALHVPPVNAFQSYLAGGLLDAFVCKISPSGDRLIYSTLLGGSWDDEGNAIAVDTAGNAYVAGAMARSLTGAVPPNLPSPTFPVTWNAIQKQFAGGFGDGFIAKLNPNGKLLYSSLFGGSGYDKITSIAVDQYGTAYIAGETSSGNLPQYNSLRAPDARSIQGFVASIVPSGPQGNSIHYYSTTLGATLPSDSPSSVAIYGIALDRALNAYVTGYNQYSGFPVTSGAFQPHALGMDAFVSKLVIAADLGLAVSASPSTAVRGSELTYTLISHNYGPDWAQYLKLDDAVPPGTTFVSYNAGGGACAAPAVGGTGNVHCTLPRLNKGAMWTVQMVVKVNSGAGSNIANTGHIRSNMQDLAGQNNFATLTTVVAN